MTATEKEHALQRIESALIGAQHVKQRMEVIDDCISNHAIKGVILHLEKLHAAIEGGHPHVEPTRDM